MKMETLKPQTIVDAVKILLLAFKSNKIKQEEMEHFKNLDENQMLVGCHHSLGRWIRNNYLLWDETSSLHKEFKSIGLWHADDMSSVLLVSVHRILNHKPIKLEEQIQYYQEYWKNANKGIIRIGAIKNE